MFEIGFRVEVDPEFPPDGSFDGGEPPERIPSGLVSIGAVLRVTVPDHAPWDIAIGAPNWWRAPSPTALAFISDWTGYLVDVVERRVLHAEEGVTRIWEAQESDLILMVCPWGIAALGRDGVAWANPQLAIDDLKVVASDPTRIVCRGLIETDDLLSGIASEIVLDPRTGELRA